VKKILQKMYEIRDIYSIKMNVQLTNDFPLARALKRQLSVTLPESESTTGDVTSVTSESEVNEATGVVVAMAEAARAFRAVLLTMQTMATLMSMR
jgi:hypothetical protein